MSRAAFARRFRELVDQPPLSCLTWWRMTAAALLLRGADEPLSAVARRVGYAWEFAFAKAFKREYGIAPGHYRGRESGSPDTTWLAAQPGTILARGGPQ